MDPCYVCQVANDEEYLSRSPCNCDVPIRIHLLCYMHVHDSICAACGTQMRPVIVNEKGHVLEFYDPDDSDNYVHYFINKNLQINGRMTIYKQKCRVAKQTYKDDQLNGPFIHYYKNLAISAIGYNKDGIRHGPMRYYDLDGRLEKVEIYENGIKISEKLRKIHQK